MKNVAGISILLVLLALALGYQAKHVGLTVDEPSHFAAAFAYWLGKDTLQPSDAPPLTRAISGWAPILGAPDPRLSKNWRSRDAYLIGLEILNTPHIRARRILFYTRLSFILFPLGIVWLIWRWARQLFSESTALLLAAFTALEPSLLGHGAIIKSDVPAAFCALLFTYNAWLYLKLPTLKRMFCLTLAASLAAVTKFTLLPLVLIAITLALWKGPRLPAVAIPVFVYGSILAISQFQASPISLSDQARFEGAGVPDWAMNWAGQLARIPWPQQFVNGLIYIGGSLHAPGFAGYMLGRRTLAWDPFYFLLCFAIKFPIPLQVLTLAGIGVSINRLRKGTATAADAII